MFDRQRFARWPRGGENEHELMLADELSLVPITLTEAHLPLHIGSAKTAGARSLCHLSK